MGKKRTISHVEEFQINYITTLREGEINNQKCALCTVTSFQGVQTGKGEKESLYNGEI